MPGSIGWTSQYLSADPLNPNDPDTSVWYPDVRWKEDSDGETRLFAGQEHPRTHFLGHTITLGAREPIDLRDIWGRRKKRKQRRRRQ